MKKFLIAALAMFSMAGSVMALDNEPEEGLTWQAQLGMNVSNINIGGPLSTSFDDLKSKIGANVGFFGRYVLANCQGTFLKFGARFNMLGASKNTDMGSGSELDQKIGLYYVDVPIHVGFQYGITEDFGVYADMGPYFGFGIAGKVKSKGYLNDALISESSNSWFKSGTGDLDMKRIDCGIGFNVGAEYDNHYILNLGLDWGLTDQAKEAVWGKSTSVKNFNFCVSLGYSF